MATIYGTSASETLRGTKEADLIHGRGGDDIIYGYAGNDRLYGGPGHDVLRGGTGDDEMRGGTGNDRYYVDSAFDQVIENSGEGFDTIYTSTHYALSSGTSVERLFASNALATTPLTLIGNELGNRIIGNAGANNLEGQAGDDTLSGRDGNDTLIGGAGVDRLNGGAGDDVFVFVDRSWDRIYDFESGSDSIDLGWLISASEFDFIGDDPFSGTPGEGRFADSKFQLDINGDRVADFQITITGELVESDFIFSALGYWDY